MVFFKQILTLSKYSNDCAGLNKQFIKLITFCINFTKNFLIDQNIQQNSFVLHMLVNMFTSSLNFYFKTI